MRLSLLIITLLFFTISFGQGPWVANNAIWKYYYTNTTILEEEGLYIIEKISDSLFNGINCDVLVTSKYQYIESWGSLVFIAHEDTNYTYLSLGGDSVMYWQNGVFRTLYDFSTNTNDSYLCHVASDTSIACNDSLEVVVSSKSNENINSVNLRKMTIGWFGTNQYTLGSYPMGTLSGIYDRFGAAPEGVAGGMLFPIKYSGICNSDLLFPAFTFLCFSDDDISIDWNCDYFETLSLDKNLTNEIKLFPNPVIDKLRLESSSKISHIVLFNQLGIQSAKIEMINQEIDLGFLTSGVYFVRITYESGEVSYSRIVKL